MNPKGPFEYRAHDNIVLHQYKAIYFPIPKVACSSLKVAISILLNITFEDPKELHRSPHRRNYPFVKKDEILTQYGEYFKFCFVRNPWDRHVSCFNNKIHKDPNFNNRWFKNGVADNFWRYGKLFSGGMSFEDFTLAVTSISDDESDEHIRSQHCFFRGKDGAVLVDFFGRFENLEADFLYVLRAINVKQDVKLPHLLKSNHDYYKTYYNDYTRELVKKRYKKDIEDLDYNF